MAQLSLGEVIKAYIVLDSPDIPYGVETPWAEVVGVIGPDEAIATLQNTSFFVPIAYGDTVRVQRNVDGEWQVVEVLFRSPHTTWAVYLVSTEEVEAANMPDQDEQKLRASNLEEKLTESGITEVIISGAIGVAPLLTITCKEPAILTDFEQALERAADQLDLTAFEFTTPLDDLTDPELFDEIDFTLRTETRFPSTNSTYDALTDSHWAAFLGLTAENLPSKVHTEFCEWLNGSVQRDQRVATDLENGRYDRVELLISRQMTDPADLEPLDGPIWKDAE